MNLPRHVLLLKFVQGKIYLNCFTDWIEKTKETISKIRIKSAQLVYSDYNFCRKVNKLKIMAGQGAGLLSTFTHKYTLVIIFINVI